MTPYGPASPNVLAQKLIFIIRLILYQYLMIVLDSLLEKEVKQLEIYKFKAELKYK
jgi:hypothetical protein